MVIHYDSQQATLPPIAIQPTQQAPNHPSYERVLQSWSISENQGSITLREFVSSPSQPLHINCEHLVELLGDAQHDYTEFGRWVFNQATVLLANIPPDSSYIDNNDWSHTAKYLFCGACFTPQPARSVLDKIDGYAHAEALVQRAVNFCEMSHSLGTTPLIVRGIIASNLRAWAESGNLDSFHFHPTALCSQPFAALLAHCSEMELARGNANGTSKPGIRLSTPYAINEQFCKASSPEEFLLWAFTHEAHLPRPDLSHKIRALLADRVGGSGGSYQELTPPAVPSDIEQLSGSAPALSTPPTLDVRRGIYVDVFGTLIHHDGTPNTALVKVLRDLMHQTPARPVFLVSDSQEEEVHSALSFLGEAPTLLMKEDLHGKELECLIDNCEPGPQGLHARHYFSPEQAVELADHLTD